MVLNLIKICPVLALTKVNWYPCGFGVVMNKLEPVFSCFFKPMQDLFDALPNCPILTPERRDYWITLHKHPGLGALPFWFFDFDSQDGGLESVANDSIQDSGIHLSASQLAGILS